MFGFFDSYPSLPNCVLPIAFAVTLSLIASCPVAESSKKLFYFLGQLASSCPAYARFFPIYPVNEVAVNPYSDEIRTLDIKSGTEDILMCGMASMGG